MRSYNSQKGFQYGDVAYVKSMRNWCKQHTPALLIETMPNYNVRK